VDAERVLRNAGRRSPGLVTLALLLSPAVRIEPELIRAVRLELIPKLLAGAEGDLWFSALVSARGLDGIVLHADVANLLRERARAILVPLPGRAIPDSWPGPAGLMRARDLIDQLHAGSPPVLKLEETVNWLAVSEAAPEPAIEAELQRAVEALRRGRTGIARWAARALPRMPTAARGTTAAWLLAQGAGRRLSSPGAASNPDLSRIDDLAGLLPARNDVPLGVSRRFGELVTLGDVDRDGVSIPVLDTDPRVLAVSAADAKDEQTVYVPKGAQVSVDIGPGAALLRTPRGEIYRIEPVPSDYYLSGLRRSCVVVQSSASGTFSRMGIAVAPDLVLTTAPEPEGESVTISRFGPEIAGEWLAGRGGLAMLRVPRLPDGVQPDRPRTMSLPSAGAQWIGPTNSLSGIGDDAWPSITGVITAINPDTGQFVASVNEPGGVAVLGGPIVVNGALAGMITSTASGGIGIDVGTIEAATVAELLNSVPEPDALPALVSAAQGIALDYHTRFRGFGRAGSGVNPDALVTTAGLTSEQLAAMNGAAEWVIQAGTSVRTQPQWRTASGPRRFSAAVLAAFDETAEVLRSSGRQPRRFDLPTGFSLTDGARSALREIGVEVTRASSSFGRAEAELDTGGFGSRQWNRLRSILAEDLPEFDDWDPWLPASAPGAERPQVMLEIVSDLCRYDTSVQDPARTVLVDASQHLYPQWWRIRDDIARTGVPDVHADQDFPDFLEAYLGWCLTILDRVAASAGGLPYDAGFSLLRSEAVTLPTERFGLEIRPGRPETNVGLSGKFGSLVSFSAWVFLELADQVRLAAQLPPRYEVPPSPASA
jgi:hypothetical protein